MNPDGESQDILKMHIINVSKGVITLLRPRGGGKGITTIWAIVPMVADGF